MSEATTKTMHCENCGTDVTLTRELGGSLLSVGCECDVRSIKVATVLPEGWNDE